MFTIEVDNLIYPYQSASVTYSVFFIKKNCIVPAARFDPDARELFHHGGV